MSIIFNLCSKLRVLHDDPKATTATDQSDVEAVTISGRPVTSHIFASISLSNGSILSTARHTTYVDAASSASLCRSADVDSFLASVSSLTANVDVAVARDAIC